MKRILVALLLTAGACNTPTPSVQSSTEAVVSRYTTISTTTTYPLAGLTRTETVVQDGGATTDQFTMTRVHSTCGDSKGAILLLPGQQANFELYEIDVSGDYTQGLVGYLATRGYDVWGYSPRTKGIAFGACDLDGCPYMANWGFATIVSDAAYIRSQMPSSGQKPVVGGWSIGAMSTIAVLNSAPHNYSGAIVWEGLLYSTNPLVIAGNVENCTQAQAQYALEAAGGSTLFTLKQIAEAEPEVLIPVVTTALPSPPASVPGYTLLAGNADQTALAYSSLDQLVLALEQGFNDYEAQKVSVDEYCSQAGDRTFTNNLHAYHDSLMIIRNGHGFGGFMDDNLNLFGTPSSKRTTLSHPEFGHGDNYAAVNHVPVLQAPIYAWLNSVFHH